MYMNLKPKFFRSPLKLGGCYHDGVVCINFNNFLSLKILGIQYLQKFINFEIKIGGKICTFLYIYR